MPIDEKRTQRQIGKKSQHKSLLVQIEHDLIDSSVDELMEFEKTRRHKMSPENVFDELIKFFEDWLNDAGFPFERKGYRTDGENGAYSLRYITAEVRRLAGDNPLPCYAIDCLEELREAKREYLEGDYKFSLRRSLRIIPYMRLLTIGEMEENWHAGKGRIKGPTNWNSESKEQGDKTKDALWKAFLFLYKEKAKGRTKVRGLRTEVYELLAGETKKPEFRRQWGLVDTYQFSSILRYLKGKKLPDMLNAVRRTKEKMG